jgi:hypothetical protein
MLDPVPVDHDEVRFIRPTWHCLLRFRQRGEADLGTDAAVEALRASLERTHLTRMPPGWVKGGDRIGELWAVDEELELAYPLAKGSFGEWTAPTVLRKGGR